MKTIHKALTVHTGHPILAALQLLAWFLILSPVLLTIAIGGTFLASFPVGYLDKLTHADPAGVGVIIGFGCLLLILFGAGWRFSVDMEELEKARQ